MTLRGRGGEPLPAENDNLTLIIILGGLEGR